MTARFEILHGLPATGPLPRWVPESWARTGREGFVVRFSPEEGPVWIGNFRPGPTAVFEALPHPDEARVLVFAGGATYAVDPVTGAVEEMEELWASAVRPIDGSADFLVESAGVAFVRLGARGIVWHSPRVSWDGFRNVCVASGRVRGEAWSPLADAWFAFSLDLTTGRVSGGAPDVPDSFREVGRVDDS